MVADAAVINWLAKAVRELQGQVRDLKSQRKHQWNLHAEPFVPRCYPVELRLSELLDGVATTPSALDKEETAIEVISEGSASIHMGSVNEEAFLEKVGEDAQARIAELQGLDEQVRGKVAEIEAAIADLGRECDDAAPPPDDIDHYTRVNWHMRDNLLAGIPPKLAFDIAWGLLDAEEKDRWASEFPNFMYLRDEEEEEAEAESVGEADEDGTKPSPRPPKERDYQRDVQRTQRLMAPKTGKPPKRSRGKRAQKPEGLEKNSKGQYTTT